MKTTGWVLTVIGVALSGVALAGCKHQDKPWMSHADQVGEPVPILNHVAGDDAGLSMPGVMLITDAAELQKTGASSLAQIPIDFSEQSLVVVALGEKTTGGYWVRIGNVQRKGDVLYVEGQAGRPAADTTSAQAVAYPYDAVVIAKQPANNRVRSAIESVTGVGMDETATPYTENRAEPTDSPHAPTTAPTSAPAP